MTLSDKTVRHGRRPSCLEFVSGNAPRSRRCRARHFFTVSASLAAAVFLTGKSAFSQILGQTLFWDTNGAAAGSSNNPDHTAPGTWGVDAFWSQDPAGQDPTTTWFSGGDAIFAAGATNPYTITVSGNQSANSITFGESVPLTLSGGTITLTGAATFNSNSQGVTITTVVAGTAGLNVGGNLTLSASNTYLNPTNIFGTLQANNSSALGTSTVAIASGASLVLLDGAPTLSNAITSLNGGTLSTQGNISHTYSAPITVGPSGATIETQTPLTVTSSLAGSGTLTKTGAATLHLTNFNVTALTISAGNVHLLPSGRSPVSTSNLSSVPTIAPASQLDVEDVALIINYGSDTTHAARDAIRNLLINGRNAGAGQAAPWNGNGGITSTYAHNTGNGFNLAIGYADNTDLAAVRASGSYTSFGGQAVASNTVLVQLTRGADATLDGVVDGQDVAIIGTHFQKPGSGQWCFGDFDYSGTCDGADVAVLGTTFGKTSPVLSPAQMSAEFGSAFTAAFEAGQSSSVPEPQCLALLFFAPSILHSRRRRLHRSRSSPNRR